MKNTVTTFQAMKDKGEKISMLTAYDYSTAKLEDAAGINGILVGDSLGNVVLGYDTTIPVTVEDMIHHGAAVARGAKNSLVVVDMPFLSYQTSVYDAVVNAGKIMKETQCDCVKLEGGKSVCPQIKAITDASIPVMAHLGLTPQSVNAFGGFKVQGKTVEAAQQLIEDAKAVEEAGEGCDGQILVYADMLSMFSDFTPKFVRSFANVGEIMSQAFKDYDAAVKDSSFPAQEHTFKIADEVLDKLY